MKSDAYFETIADQLWEEYYCPRARRRRARNTRVRIKKVEWEELVDLIEHDKNIIADPKLGTGHVAYLVVTRYFCPVYQYTSKRLITLTHENLTVGVVRDVHGRFVSRRGTFDDGWRVFEPITHSTEMRKRRKDKGLEEAPDKHYFEY